jgi:hypothetical protein
MKIAVTLSAALSACACLAVQAGAKIQINAHFYQLKSAIDVNSIKAIGSPQTKASPSILHVTKAESGRITALVLKGGGNLVGSPSIITMVDQQAKISTDSAGGMSYTLDVKPSTKGSDTITLNFRLSVTTIDGKRKTTRSATSMARVQESKALLIIENPRDGQPGLLTVLEAHRVK